MGLLQKALFSLTTFSHKWQNCKPVTAKNNNNKKLKTSNIIKFRK